MAGSWWRGITAVLLVLGAAAAPGERPIYARAPGATAAPAPTAAAGPSQRSPAGPPRWWKDPAIQKELALTHGQVKRIDEIFTRFQADIEPLGKEIATHDRELDALIAEARVDASLVETRARVLTALRAPVNAARITMIYRTSLVLTHAQRMGLATVMARRRNRGASSWWKDAAIQKELALTDAQVTRLDDIYTAFQTDVGPLGKEIAAHEHELDALIARAEADPVMVEAKARILTALRAPLNAARITMLYRMSLVLTPAQRTGLAAMIARRRSG